MMKENVGVHAGYVWNLLSKKGKMNLEDICKHVDCSDPLILMVVGWLLREDKIICEDNKGHIFVQLKSPSTEIYYG